MTSTHDRVATLAQDLPGITFGYIGNLTPRYDDRSWFVFLPNPDLTAGTDSDRVYLGNNAQPVNEMTQEQWNGVECRVRRLYAAKPGRAEAAARIAARKAQLMKDACR